MRWIIASLIDKLSRTCVIVYRRWALYVPLPIIGPARDSEFRLNASLEDSAPRNRHPHQSFRDPVGSSFSLTCRSMSNRDIDVARRVYSAVMNRCISRDWSVFNCIYMERMVMSTLSSATVFNLNCCSGLKSSLVRNDHCHSVVNNKYMCKT